MAERFIQVTFSFVEPFTKERHDQLRDVFNLGLDWMRFASNSWLIYTRVSTDTWFTRFRNVIRANELVLILEVDPSTAQGLMRNWMWRWLEFDRTTTKTVGDAVAVDPKQAILPRAARSKT